MNKVNDSCKFCGDKKPLIRAHIIPKFFHKLLNENGVARMHHRKKTPKTSKRSPGGVVDENLVCAECEALFSPYDDYAKHFFLGDFENLRVDFPVSKGKMIRVDKYNYTKLKLFFITLLWRASASKHDFCEQVEVGKYDDRLKEMIKRGDPGKNAEFPVILMKYTESLSKQQYCQPTRFREKSKRLTCYHFFFGGFKARIKVDNRKYSEEYRPLLLNPTPPLLIPEQSILDCGELKTFMTNYLEKL